MAPFGALKLETGRIRVSGDPELDVERLTGAQEQSKPVLLFDEKLKVLIQVRILLEESLRSRTPQVALDGLRMLLIAQRVSLLSFDDIMP